MCASITPTDWPIPAGYLGWLRELVGPDAWIVIEKILAVDEPLELTLPVAGTTGYDALREIGGVFVDPHGAAGVDGAGRIVGRRLLATLPMLADLKRSSATETLASELARLRRAIVAAAGADHPQLPDAVAALLTHIDVYRSDYRRPGRDTADGLGRNPIRRTGIGRRRCN